MKNLTIIFYVLILSVHGWARSSRNTLSKFEIVHCAEDRTCFSASGLKGYVSMGQELFSAGNVQLKISAVNNEMKEDMLCDSFKYNFQSHYVICDNMEVQKTSVIIDQEFKIQKIAYKK